MIRYSMAFAGLFLILLIQPGCSTYHKVVDSTSAAMKSVGGIFVSAVDMIRLTGKSDDRFIKKIGIADTINNVSGSDPVIQEMFQKKLEEDLTKECDGIKLINIGDFDDFFGYGKEHAYIPEKDAIPENPFLFVEKAKAAGFSAVVTASILSISSDKKSTGMLWFRKNKFYLEISVVGIIYDVETGVKLSEELYEQEFRIDKNQYEQLKNGRAIEVSELIEAISEITESFAEDFNDKVGDQPYKSYIVENDGKSVVLSSGKSTGIQEGDVMNVYDLGGVIEGAENINYMIPGKKVAEITITQVFPDKAYGAFSTGKVDTVQNVVIPKD